MAEKQYSTKDLEKLIKTYKQTQLPKDDQQKPVPKQVNFDSDYDEAIEQAENEREDQGKYNGGKIKNYADGSDGKVKDYSIWDKVKQSLSSSPDIYNKFANTGISAQDLSKGTKQSFGDVDNKFNGGKVKGYADGSDGPVSNEDFEKHLQDLKDQGYKVSEPMEGPEQDITAKATAPASEADVTEKQTPEDKNVEQQYANEDFEASEKADESKQPSEEEQESEEEPSEEDQQVMPSEDMDETRKAIESIRNLQDTKPDEQKIQENDVISKLLMANNPKYAAQQLADAQQERRGTLLAGEMAKYGNLIGAGIAGHGAQPLPPGYFDTSKLAQLPVQEYAEQISNQQNDPNSPMSKITRDYLRQKYHIDIPENASFADIKGVAGFALKDAQLQNALSRTMANINSRTNIAANKLVATAYENDQNRALKKELANRTLDKKDQDRIVGLGSKYDKQIDSKVYGARNALGMATRTSLFADKIPALLNQYKNLNDAPPTIVSDANNAFANLISQGVPGERMLAKLDAANLPKNAAGFWQYLTASPTGAGQKDLLKLVSDSAQQQKTLAQTQIKDYVIPTLKLGENEGLTGDQLTLLQKKYGIQPEEYNRWQMGGQLTKEFTTGKKTPTSKTISQAQFNEYERVHGPGTGQLLLKNGYSIGQ